MDTNFLHSIADTVLLCPDPNTSDPFEWLYVSLNTPFSVLIAYLAYHNKSPRSAVNLAGI